MVWPKTKGRRLWLCYLAHVKGQTSDLVRRGAPERRCWAAPTLSCAPTAGRPATAARAYAKQVGWLRRPMAHASFQGDVPAPIEPAGVAQPLTLCFLRPLRHAHTPCAGPRRAHAQPLHGSLAPLAQGTSPSSLYALPSRTTAAAAAPAPRPRGGAASASVSSDVATTSSGGRGESIQPDRVFTVEGTGVRIHVFGCEHCKPQPHIGEG